MARELQGLHVVVVGASGVLGSKVAAQLTQGGAQISAIVRDGGRVDAAQVARVAIADITDSKALREAFEQLAPFDGVVNAAGVVAFGNIVDLDDETLTKLFAINAIAPMRMLRDSAPHISQGGFFLNISAVVAQQPMAGMAAYSSSKAAVWGAMMAATRELRRQGIEVIDARPPHTETGLADRPVAGVAPKLPTGLEPDAVAARLVAAIKDGERDLPVEAFTA